MTKLLAIIQALLYAIIIFGIPVWQDAAAINLARSKLPNEFTPPPIPIVNTPSFKAYVNKYHTFPSPYGYEPYRDNQGKSLKFLLSELNDNNPYIPVTFTYNSHTTCPIGISVKANQVTLHSRDGQYRFTFGVNNGKSIPYPIIGFYFPNDPHYYTQPRLFHALGNIKYGDPIVTILFSQRTLQSISETGQGFIDTEIKEKGKRTEVVRIPSPFADGKESLSIGTTLYVIGLGQSSGVEFTEMVSQTTGETSTKQIQTGFSLNLNLQYEMMIGGGIFPASETVRVGVNRTLTTLVGNELSINNQSTVTRSYTIKPGINDTYYWAVYQLGYSHRINAPQFETVLKRLQDTWKNRIRITIADNQMTQDGKPIGNVLPPQASGTRNDITVGVAVPISLDAKTGIYMLKRYKDGRF